MTVIAAVGVIVVAGALLFLARRGRGSSGSSLDSQAKGRLDKELQHASVVETFEKAMAGENRNAGPVMARLAELDTDEKLRLSAESLNVIGTLLAQEGQHLEALNWLEQSLERDAAYFRTLNAAIAFEVTRSDRPHPDLPQYPFHYAPPIEVDPSTLLRAQLYHNLDRPLDMERVLTPGIAKPEYRYLRAECRRLEGRTKEALADFQELAKNHPDFVDVSVQIAQLSGKPVTPNGTAKVEKATTSDKVAPVAKPTPTAEATAPVAKAVATANKIPPVPKAPGATSDKVPVIAKAAPTTDKVAVVAKAAATSDRVDPVSRPPPRPAPPPPAGEAAPPQPPTATEPTPPPQREPRRALATPQWNNDFDPRAILGVGPSATLDEIRAAYLTLTKLHHPDRVATKGTSTKALAEEKMRDINRAWRELTRDAAPSETA